MTPLLEATALGLQTLLKVHFIVLLLTAATLLLRALWHRHCRQPEPLSLPQHRSASIEVLPIELLELIFRRFRHRPLLGIVSLICKRWRRATLRLVTHVKVCEPYVARRLLEQTPHIEHLSYSVQRHLYSLLVAPPSVTSFYFGDSLVQHDGNDIHQRITLPPLKKLSVPAMNEPLLYLLAHSRTSLESLHIRMEVLHSLDDLLTDLHLPSLSSLNLKLHCFGAGILLGFVKRHASQLTELNVDAYGDDSVPSQLLLDNLVSLPLTRLRRLTLFQLQSLSITQLECILRTASLLCELEVDMNGLRRPYKRSR